MRIYIVTRLNLGQKFYLSLQNGVIAFTPKREEAEEYSNLKLASDIAEAFEAESDHTGPTWSEAIVEVDESNKEFCKIKVRHIPEDIYEELKEAGCTIDHHESDLYVLDDATSFGILAHHPEIHKAQFRGSDGNDWFELPFMYTPWWADQHFGRGASTGEGK